jgi:adenosylhomocysteine nucleosidase
MLRAWTLSLVALLVVAPSVRSLAQAPEPAPVIIQGAMPIELDALRSRLDDARLETVGGWTFWKGTLDGYPVVVSLTLRGMSNAAAATAIAVQRYRPVAIINQGTSGGHDPALHVADIVIGMSAVNIGAFRSPFRAVGRGSDPLDWMPLDLTAEGSAINATDHTPARFQADASLLEAARHARSSYTKVRVVEGVIGSSDMWNDELDLIARFHASFGTAVEEMETASAAQIASQLHVPFIGIRVLSDNTTNGEAYDPKTSEVCEAYVVEVAKAYISSLKR